CHDSENGKQNLGFWLFFTYISASEKFNRICFTHLNQIGYKCYKKNYRKKNQGRADTAARHFILKGCLISDNLIEQKKHQSSKDNSAKNSRQDTGASDHQGFPEHHNGNLFLSHSENIIKADLFSPLL